MTSASNVKERLERIAEHVEGVLGAPLELRAGLTDAAIDALTGAVGLQLPDEVHSLYRWRDGVDRAPRDFGGHLYPGWWFLPLEAAVKRSIEVRVVMDDLCLDLGLSPVADQWLCAFEEFGNDSIVLRCGGEVAPVHRHIVTLPEPDVPPYVDSLHELLSRWEHMYDLGAIQRDDQGRLERRGDVPQRWRGTLNEHELL